MTSRGDWWVLISLVIITIGPFAVIYVLWMGRRQFGFPRRGSLLAIAAWADSVGKSEAEVKTATFGDLILFVTLYVIGITLFVTWYAGKAQAEIEAANQVHAALKEAETVQNEQAKTYAVEINGILAALHGVPQPIEPSGDEQIIAPHVDLYWQYWAHNRSTKYVVQLIRVQDEYARNISTIEEDSLGNSIIVSATDSNDLTTHLDLPEGSYLWRVGVYQVNKRPAPISSNLTTPYTAGVIDSDNDEVPIIQLDQFKEASANAATIQDWSPFRKFSFYHSRLARIYRTHRLLVGSGATTEVWQLDNKIGQYERNVIEGVTRCLIVKGNTVLSSGIRGNKDDMPQDSKYTLEYDSSRCISTHDSVHNTTAAVTPFYVNTGDKDWASALQSGDVDVYIGTLTKAIARQKDSRVIFSDGYLDYTSEFLVEKSDNCRNITCLANLDAKVGVLADTTNLQLALRLSADSPLDRLRLVTFKTPSDLERAYESREIRAVVIDSVLRPELGMTDTRALPDMCSMPGWAAYLKDDIGSRQEQFAIAVATNGTAGASKSLVTPIDSALRNETVRQSMTKEYDYLGLKTREVFVTGHTSSTCPPKQ
jgi:hypothetical protein